MSIRKSYFGGRFCFNIRILSQPLSLRSVPHHPVHTHTCIYVYTTYICACMVFVFFTMYMRLLTDLEVKPPPPPAATTLWMPFHLPPASCGTTPIILCRCLERTNVYCYYKAAFVVIAGAPCPLLLVSALLSFCVGLGGGREGGWEGRRWWGWGWGGVGGIGAARRLCSGSVIRKGGRESASQQDSLFYIHQMSCL